MYFYQIKCCFVIRIYSVTGRRYVMKKVDELTKNRREMDRENISGHMPEDREMPEYCPVRNFETYLQKLHPQCNRLWQFPTDSFNISDECWFQKRPIGKDTLASFMFTLSKKTGLSQIYTNHSIRATGATILGRNCSMTQIMAVTGHKSASSVAVYQRVSSKEKQVMGDIITSSVRGEQPSQLSSIMPPHSTSRLQLMPPTQNSSSSTSLVQMRANTHVSSSVTDVVDILDVIMMIYFVIITLLQQLIPSQTPEQFSKLPCSTAVPLQI